MKSHPGRDLLVVLALCVVGGLMGRFQNQARARGEIDPISRTVSVLVSPLSTGLNSVFNSMDDFFGSIFGAQGLIDENRRLKAEVNVARLYSEQLSRLEREIDSLRKLQNLPATVGKKKIPADVIEFFQYENRITINVGSEQEVEVGLAVITSQGLVGQVQTVDKHRSQVLLISSPKLKIGAIDVSRNPSPAGLISGENFSSMILEFADPNAPVQNRDEIVTSGFSEKIPRGIPIGRVIQVYDDPNFGLRRAQVFPHVGLGEIREVVVLK